MILLKIKLFLIPWNVPKWESKTADGWINHEIYNKEVYPIRWFLFETCAKFLKYKIYSKFISFPLLRLNNWFKHTFVKKYQHHIIRPRFLKKQYYDYDTRILHASFEMLSQFFESLDDNFFITQEYIDASEYPQEKESLQSQLDFQIKVTELYVWWNNIRPNRENNLLQLPSHLENLHEKYGILFMMADLYKDYPDVIEYKKIINENNQLYTKWNEEDKNMLKNLIEIAPNFWN